MNIMIIIFKVAIFQQLFVNLHKIDSILKKNSINIICNEIKKRLKRRKSVVIMGLNVKREAITVFSAFIFGKMGLYAHFVDFTLNF